MQSQGSTSSQPSFDSLSSSDSFLFSDSEQAEDDTDVFLTDSSPSVIISGAGGATTDQGGGSESPGSQWACDSFTDKEEEEESDRSESSSGAHIRVDETDTASHSPKSQGDLLFAQKCAELQGFVRPLLELLNGLKRGRFDRGLSSFQQSVAMDRIQRIVGVLQRPNSGEKYLNTLLQVEMMLKLWFPQIPTHSVPAASSSATTPDLSVQDIPRSTPPHKHRDQLHIPVKAGQCSEPSLTWVHVAPILSPPKACLSHKGTSAAGNNENQPVNGAALPPSSRGSPATQDSSISSTTPYKHPKNQKNPIRCQSQPVAGQQSETLETCQGQSASPPVTLQPLPKVCPAPVET
uniref:Circadian associated repressor of transcription n=1 Tax=Myripristis murdjan TaxID=586833 RepID=A0A667WL85_9TELE